MVNATEPPSKQNAQEKDRVLINGKPVASLYEAFCFIDKALRAGGSVEKRGLRELCSLLFSDELMASKLKLSSNHWPIWTRGPVLDGLWLATARRNGRTEPFVELFVETELSPPVDEERVPIQAWAVLYRWLTERGHVLGVDLPIWVWNYLEAASEKMETLRADRSKSSAHKLRLVPDALGYTRGRRNVFADDEKALRDEVAALVYDDDGKKGLTGDARIEGVKALLGIEDTRTAKLYIAKGRRAAKRPPPWLKK